DGLTVTRVRPEAVVLPRSTDEVSGVVRLLHGARIPVVPRGAGTGLSGGAVPLAGGVVVALVRMRRILGIDLENRTATVEAGLVNDRLTKAADGFGLLFAPDPSSQRVCTIGGNIAENASGPHCHKNGPTGRHVLALTVVLPDGEIVRIGAESDGPGYDLVGLWLGSEGVFGIVTEAVVRLLPRPSAVRTLLANYTDLAAACEAVSSIVRAGIIPVAMELIDGVTMRAVEPFARAGFPADAAASLLIELDGRPEEVEAEHPRVERILREAGAREVRIASTDEDRARLWAGRKLALAAYGRVNRCYYMMDGVVPRRRLAEVMRKTLEIGSRHRVVIANISHAGDGNLHPNILFDDRVPGEFERVLAASNEILDACLDAGGSLTGEHGVGHEKREHMRRMFQASDLAWFDRVRRIFDPDGRMNPGKVLPEGVRA
ncbi:MAG: FAD-linked oxidase C-terminal domain-containing protein, partial [Planctomycetota bacterium]